MISTFHDEHRAERTAILVKIAQLTTVTPNRLFAIEMKTLRSVIDTLTSGF
jgi:hypothetical protein